MRTLEGLRPEILNMLRCLGGELCVAREGAERDLLERIKEVKEEARNLPPKSSDSETSPQNKEEASPFLTFFKL